MRVRFSAGLAGASLRVLGPAAANPPASPDTVSPDISLFSGLGQLVQAPPQGARFDVHDCWSR
jgi:hypothetical protein